MQNIASWIEANIKLNPKLKATQTHLLWRNVMGNIMDKMHSLYASGFNINELIKFRAQAFDHLFKLMFKPLTQLDNVTLVAIGGYGRYALHPYSDIDLLLIIEEHTKHLDETLSKFFTALWDLNIKFSHSVRTLLECHEDAKSDLFFTSSLLEARYIVGSKKLFDDLRSQFVETPPMSAKKFFEAKFIEQQQRHKKYNLSEYNVEPNIKSGPGGLRDIQTLHWLARYIYNCKLEGLIKHEIITKAEYDLISCERSFLWKIRFSLHLLAGRQEDRLIFHYQPELAEQLGFHAKTPNEATEKFMHSFFQSCQKVRLLNEIALQAFTEKFSTPSLTKPTNITTSLVGVYKENLYLQIPEHAIPNNSSLIIEIFILWAKDKGIKGLSANAIRQISANVNLINDDFKNKPKNQQLFLELLSQKENLTKILHHMSRYGVLGAYISEYKNIIGLMQYDLFHTFTVDMHIISVIRYLKQFSEKKYNQKFPLCNKITKNLPVNLILILTALYHDIAKGSGGEHASKGSKIAEAFCKKHKLAIHDTELITWLVENHILLSHTAQRFDISDKNVIEAFARKVKTPERLDYLYVFTVADICATNDKLWNSWRDALFKRLYYNTNAWFKANSKDFFDKNYQLNSHKKHAFLKMKKHGLNVAEIENLWEVIPDEYFYRETEPSIISQTCAILKHKNQNNEKTLVEIHYRVELGCSEILIFMPDTKHLFATCVSTLENMGIKVLEAKICTTKDHFAIDIFDVLSQHDEPLFQDSAAKRVCSNLKNRLHTLIHNPESFENLNKIHIRLPKKFKYLPLDTKIKSIKVPGNSFEHLSIITPNKPGALTAIALSFSHYKLSLHSAKIHTFGDKLEGIFKLSRCHGIPFSKQDLMCLQQILHQHIEKIS